VKPEPEKKKTETTKKTAAAGKGSTAGAKKSNFDCDVTLPVQVKARGFSSVIEGTGTMKLSAVADKLIEEGYNQLLIKNIALIYLDSVNTVYVTDGKVFPSNEEDMAELEDGKTITVVDGQLKAEFSLADFEGKEEDEVSLKDVAERFAKVNPYYTGCKLYYDPEAGLAYPLMSKVLSTEKVQGSINVIVNGNLENYTEEDAQDMAELLKKICGVGVGTYISKSENTYFVSYETGKHKAYAKKESNVVSQKTKTVEKKYPLPMELYIVTWNMRVNLTPEMFGGAEKVTTKQISDVMAKQQRMFADSERKVDYLYNEETKMMSCMFISGKKGAHAYEEMAEREDAFTGLWKLIHSEAELAKRKAEDFFLGLYCEGLEHFKLVALPHGNFLGYFGKEKECCDVKRVVFERKLPKIDRELLEHIIEYFRSDLSVEMMVRILYNKNTGEFLSIAAAGDRTKMGISYDFSGHRALMALPGMISVMEIHSHNTMPAFFSTTDNEDEQYPGVFGVIGNLDQEHPTMKFRCGLDGMFGEVSVDELFTE